MSRFFLKKIESFYPRVFLIMFVMLTTLPPCLAGDTEQEVNHLLHFVEKVSVQFVSSSGAESQPFFFKEHDPRECAQTWQVTRADGVGPKLAVRILTELKDKAGSISLGPSAAAEVYPAAGREQDTDDAISALVNLGYGRADAFAAVAEAARRIHGDKQLDVLIPAALKELAR